MIAKPVRRCFWLIPVVLSTGFFLWAQDEDLPEGKGKLTVEHTCTECHGLDKVLAKPRTRENWRAVITKMRAQGATMTDEEFDAVIDYLFDFMGADEEPPPDASEAGGSKPQGSKPENAKPENSKPENSKPEGKEQALAGVARPFALS
jgi:hypothetical protein